MVPVSAFQITGQIAHKPAFPARFAAWHNHCSQSAVADEAPILVCHS